MAEKILDELEERGLIFATTLGIEERIHERLVFYFGIDPTGGNLHIGHLVGLLTCKRLVDAGHRAIILMGGGTAMIGDPSGKDAERPMVEEKIIEENKEKLKMEVEKFVEVDGERVMMVDNAEWLTNVNIIEFLREAGKYMPISTMMEKESVKMRLEREQGLSFAEFSYQLLQAYDFLELWKRYGCNAQIGGSDQWGNILQGVDLIRRKEGAEADGIAFPLIVDAKTGKKFGKTESGAAIWLDGEKTHPFFMYQFFMNVDDEMAEKLVMYYSFKSIAEIGQLIERWKVAREDRELQKALAFEVVEMIHGREAAERAKKVSEILFYKSEQELSEEDLVFVGEAIGSVEMSRKEAGVTSEVLVKLGLAESMGEAKRLVKQGGVSEKEYFSKYILVRKGKKDYGLVKLV